MIKSVNPAKTDDKIAAANHIPVSSNDTIDVRREGCGGIHNLPGCSGIPAECFRSMRMFWDLPLIAACYNHTVIMETCTGGFHINRFLCHRYLAGGQLCALVDSRIRKALVPPETSPEK